MSDLQKIKATRKFYNDFNRDINATIKFLNACMPVNKTPVVAKAISDLKELKEDAAVVKANQEKSGIVPQKTEQKKIFGLFVKKTAPTPAPETVFAARLTKINDSWKPYGSK